MESCGTSIPHVCAWHTLLTFLMPHLAGDSRFLLTASGDQTAVIWEVATGRRIAKIEHKCVCALHDASNSLYLNSGPVRGAKWAEGGRMFVTARDSFNASRENASIRIYRFDEDNFEVGGRFRARLS
jgi:hypothetical protein